MPSYYQSGKFNRKIKKQKAEAVRISRELEEEANSKSKKIPEKLLLDIGKKIARLRISAGLTQGKLAKLIGTYQSAIGRIESGKENLTLKNLEKITKFFNKELKIELL